MKITQEKNGNKSNQNNIHAVAYARKRLALLLEEREEREEERVNTTKGRDAIAKYLHTRTTSPTRRDNGDDNDSTCTTPSRKRERKRTAGRTAGNSGLE
jgi:hypothetical protein